MIILGIETSCDETAAAVLLKDSKGIQILSNVVASSASIQAKYGGVIPEQAAREQIKSIIPVIQESLQVSGYSGQKIDAIAVTYGPGLIGSLLVGVETAKVLSSVWNKPLIPVNHLLGHFYANWISSPSLRGFEEPEAISSLKTEDCFVANAPRNDVPGFPCLGLLVSGGHTDLVLFKNHHQYTYLGGTRDDAAGECFDKCARLLGLPYPGGPEISKLAQKGNPQAFNLPRPMIDSKNLDFSFSGLKTAVANLLSQQQYHTPGVLHDLAASIEAAIVDVLVEKTTRAAKQAQVEQIIVAGGVAANQKLFAQLRTKTEFSSRAMIFTPPPYLCTDNAAMIASRAFFEKPIRQLADPLKLQADPSLSLD